MSPNDISTTNSATEVRDLRTGEQVWRAYRSSAPSAERLRSGLSVDVAILGAGISGALLAEAATARGLSTVVLDRRPPGHGSTAASTALLQFEIDTPLIHLAASIGLERAARIWQRSYRSVQDLARLVRSLGIACDWQNRNAVYLAGNVLNPGRLAEEFVMRQSIGLPTILLGRADLHGLAGIDREAALYSQGAAEVNPVQLTDGLLTIAQRRGCRLLAPVQIADVQPSSGGVMLASDDGMEIAARALVFATGYELAHGVPTEGHKRTSTWAFATKAQPGAVWPNRELIWEAADPYLYIRTTLDGRVIVGGEDEDIDDETLRDALLPVKIEALQAKAKALLPALDVAADFRWTGTFGESEAACQHRGHPRHAWVLWRPGLRRQRHNLRHDRLADPRRGAVRRSRSRCRALRVRASSLILAILGWAAVSKSSRCSADCWTAERPCKADVQSKSGSPCPASAPSSPFC